MHLLISKLITITILSSILIDVTCSSTRILPEISVKIGQVVELFPSADIPVSPLKDQDYCILEVIQNDPLYSMVGQLTPSVSVANQHKVFWSLWRGGGGGGADEI